MSKTTLAGVLLFILTFVLVLSYLAAVAQDQSRIDGRSAYKIIRDLLKDGIDAYNNTDIETAKINIDSVLILDSTNFEALLYKSKISAGLGDTTGAILFLEESIIKAPRSTILKLSLAKLKLDQDVVDEAYKLIDEVLLLQPANSKALFMKGLIYLKKGDTLEALENMEKALATAVSDIE